ncbi:hypothetical protein AX14_009458 [Amanita brunnescens Koide BX004]|nr:hypothetical protein AX14_009458 [Amanita brunnescens Koide BX004]
MPSSLTIPLLLAGMILTGSSNSLWSKWQDMQCVENCADPDPANHVLFEQPVWQTLQMFVGEMLCFLPVLFSWVQSRRQAQLQLPLDSEQVDAPLKLHSGQVLTGWKMVLFWIPAICDLTGTTLMNVGLLYTPVSIYQMTRGALVLFVGTFSVLFLRRRLWFYQWLSLVVVMAGVGLVGYSGSLIKDAVKQATLHLLSSPGRPNTIQGEEPELTKAVVGVFFILLAQIFTATQFVVEERLLGRYTVEPLVAVGLEGSFGALSVLLLMPILSIPSISVISPFFDLPRGWRQMIYTPSVLWSSVAIACSISLFNYCGLSVTRHVSATARSLTDTCRTLAIWLISLGLGWEKLLFPISVLQVLGFSLLVYGTLLFNDLVAIPPCISGPPATHVVDDVEENEALIRQSLDETATLPVDLGRSGFDVIPETEHAAHVHGKRSD